MCFAKAPKVEAPAPVPAPAPAPVITPSEVSPQSANEARRKRLDALRYGLASTIKTGPRGLVGAGAELSSSGQGKQKLGA
jgi:hypothetical protein